MIFFLINFFKLPFENLFKKILPCVTNCTKLGGFMRLFELTQQRFFYYFFKKNFKILIVEQNRSRNNRFSPTSSISTFTGLKGRTDIPPLYSKPSTFTRAASVPNIFKRYHFTSNINHHNNRTDFPSGDMSLTEDESSSLEDETSFVATTRLDRKLPSFDDLTWTEHYSSCDSLDSDLFGEDGDVSNAEHYDDNVVLRHSVKFQV